MTNLVVDASVAVEFLLRTPVGDASAPLLSGHKLYAPELLDAEVLAVLRRKTLRAEISEKRSRSAVDDLRDMPVSRMTHRGLLDRAWGYRHNLSAYDALYVATAVVVGAALLTADGPLSRMPKMPIPIHNVIGG